MTDDTTPKPPKRRVGRPRKDGMASKQKNPVGRPKGTAAIMNDYKDRMLASPKSKKVIEAIFDAAMDPEHKNQIGAMKLIVDRILPIGMFEKEVVKGAGRNQIQINITGVGGDTTVVSAGDEDLEGELVNE